jgi:Bacteriophage T4-like portal protein (Gp20)/Intein splicing domain
MAKTNLTIFQKLGQILGPDGFKLKQTQQAAPQRYKLDNNVLLKTTDKKEYELAKLQAQQNKYIGQVWKKVEHGLFQQAVNYETTRIGSYSDFEAMEFYPEISAALDIMMEECLAGSTLIPLLNGERVEIKELYDKKLENFWVYAVDTKTNKIKPSKVDKVVFKGIKDTYKITLDDNTQIECTDNHKWLKSDNSWIETKDLKLGDSLKSISIKLDNKGYEQLSFSNFKKDKIHTHRMVAENVLYESKKLLLNSEKVSDQNIVIHHKSFNKLNNDPNQLEYMFWDEHQKLHTDLNQERWKNHEFSEKMKKIFSKTAKNNWEKSYKKTKRYKFFKDFMKTIGNHRIIKIEYVGKQNVYDLVNSRVSHNFGVMCNNGMIISHNCTTLNNNGRMLNVYSESNRIKGIIEDLLYNRLDIHTALPMWTRNTIKYGDNFVFLHIDDTNGVIGSKQMPNFEMERRDGALYDILTQRMNEDYKADKVKFYWRGRDVEFNSWQIAHFRLFGDDRRLPYGTSMLEKARRIWKQLLLSEDAMLVYRVTRAPERRIYKIYVGNIDDKDVEPYVNEIANRFKRTPMVDPQTGQIDLRYNQLSNDQDYFIPVRSEDAPSPIDTLPGAQNLDQIADIEYLQKKLFTALRVPKPFLGFDETTGEGKNLALQDVRFSRTINRIQQAMIQELNKIIIIHLYLLGFEDELDNFTITLNNPSTQAEMLKVEHLQLKVTLYRDAVSDAGNGFGTMSMTRAHREILGWSDNDIKQDLLEQRMEKAAAAELQNSASVIKHTGVFDVVDRIYGDINVAMQGGTGTEQPEKESGGPAAGGGGFGGGGTSDADLDFGIGAAPEGEGGEAPEGEAEAGAGAEEAPEAGGEAGAGAEKPETTAEAIKKTEKLLMEKKEFLNKKLVERTEKYKNVFVNRLIGMLDNEPKSIEKTKIYDKNMKINEGVNTMIKEIDDMLGDEE